MGKSTKKQQRAKKHREWAKHYKSLLEIQGSGGCCAICGNPPKEGGRRLHLDSDHKTESLRGAICGNCNRRLKYYLTVEWLRDAADYLEDPPLAGIDLSELDVSADSESMA